MPTDLKSAFALPENTVAGRGEGGSELSVQECAAFGGWRLLLVGADPRSWFELWRAGRVWSGEHSVAYDHPIGQFPTVAASDKVEWRRGDDGFWRALIFRVEAGKPEDAPGKVARLFVVRLAGEDACFLGKAATNEEARALADGPSSCQDAKNRVRGGTSPRAAPP
jgi:hypothetical protein